jgi:hypothetical protein
VTAPTYRAQIWEPGANFAIGTLLAEFETRKHIGWAKYLNDIGEAFFTVNQTDRKLRNVASDLRDLEGIAHMAILRDDECVWRGFLGEHDADERDAIFYGYGYEAHLFWLVSLWNQTWKNEEVGDIVTDLSTRFKTGIPDSPLAFVTIGTIEDPVTTSGGSTKIELPSYKLYYKRILFALKELTSAATSDTTNTCFFEFAHSSVPTTKTVTFNLWKNKSTDQSIRLAWGTNISRFGERFAPILARNHVIGVGSGAHNLLLRTNQSTAGGSRGYTAFGRRQEPVYLSWVRDQTELERVIKLRKARALRFDTDLWIQMKPNSLPPLDGYALGDRFPVHIDRGITQIDKTMQMVGMQVLANRGSEIVRPIMLDRSGS